MAKKTFFFLLLIIPYFLTSCQSKDEELVEKKWILFSRDQVNSTNRTYYKKSEEALSFQFYLNGIVTVTTKIPYKKYEGLWLRNKKNQDLIEINCKDTLINFYTTGIKNNMLIRTEIGDNLYTEFYKTSDDPTWPSDALIDAMNNTGK